MIKKYSLNIDTKNDKIVSVEVDGVRYADVDEIPDDDDRGRMLLITTGYTDVMEMALETAPGKSISMSKVIPLIFLAVALLMLVIALISATGARRSIAREESTPGKVIEMVERKGTDDKNFYYPVVEFYLPDGTRQTAQVSEGSWPPAYEVDDLVTVRYEREQPRNARIASANSTLGIWTVTLITGILCAAFSIGALFSFWVIRQKPF